METIRCCIACILPCGALDVVRIVHSNGRVEEISEPVLAGEIMKAYPKHSAEGEKERLLANERYLSEIMKEKASTARDRRRGRVAVWRPHLESITEDDL
uniref:Uncharacterized protein n=1 Tax=Aegilops tauschii TaxID=37682 RepID=R7W6D3_AEGTA